MTRSLTRRDFVATTAATATWMMAGRPCLAQSARKRKKALIGDPLKADLAGWKAAGFDGMEARTWDATPEAAKAGRKAADAAGLRIHSVMRGWTNFNSDNRQQVEADVKSVHTALQTAEIYGADTVLLVPCRIGTKEMEIPKPWEFDIDFDEKTGMIRRVVDGDNAPYAEYIAAHNRAAETSRKAIERLISAAERTSVIVALENVWNNLWVKPQIFASYIAAFDSPWIQGYYDIGNNVKYAPSQDWIRALEQLIVKCHVKDFAVDRGVPRGGQFVDIRDGDVNWPEVMKTLDQVGYVGWMTIEGSRGLSVEEQSQRLDLILAGK